MIFLLSSIYTGLEFWSVHHTSIYENSESKILETKFLNEISNNWLNNLFGTHAYKTLEFCW